ncbi:RNA polymerase, sigma-24 subunit, RpoE [Fibrobacter sp. UWB15]|nr:RNA polymerase RpoE-like sigma-24 subunit [Fibrobacter sp. UWB6]SHG29748.1 RNA polymerase, sigma-24 subunit, RpoE [Fibrobacter sp. UWB8]SMG36866.1 RNA polymerase, sigma-24 subunit, RpoE [Fibrobacter sp. UWB15]
MQPAGIQAHLKGTMDEKVILQHLKGGSREALSLLWQAHSANVLNLAFRMMKDRDEAEDILMDVFVQAPKAVQGFRGESALGTWLYRLTVNACLMKLRAQKRHRELEEEHLDSIIEEALGKGDLKNENFDPELLEKGLAELPAESRSMLWLKDAEDLDVKDLAEIYKMPEGTIKARLSRARHFVKNYLKERKNHA